MVMLAGKVRFAHTFLEEHILVVDVSVGDVLVGEAEEAQEA